MGGGMENQAMAKSTPYATSSNTQEEIITTESIVQIATSTSSRSIKEMVGEYFADIPELVDVARCESRFRHFDKNGRVLRGEINRGDIGVMQINEYYHKERAEELGFDLYTIEGNMSYARVLYEKEGLTPWASSSHCWKPREIARK